MKYKTYVIEDKKINAVDLGKELGGYTTNCEK